MAPTARGLLTGCWWTYWPWHKMLGHRLGVERSNVSVTSTHSITAERERECSERKTHIKNEVKVVSYYFTPWWMSSRAFISIIRRLFFFFFWALRRAFSCMHNLLSHRASFWNLLISSGSRSSGTCYSYPPPPPKNTNKQKTQRKKERSEKNKRTRFLSVSKRFSPVNDPKPRDRPCKF